MLPGTVPVVGGGGRVATGGGGGGAWLKLVGGLKKFTSAGAGSGLNTLNGRLSVKRAGSLRFELGRGGGERTFSVDLDRLSRTVLVSGGSGDGSKGAAANS